MTTSGLDIGQWTGVILGTLAIELFVTYVGYASNAYIDVDIARRHAAQLRGDAQGLMMQNAMDRRSFASSDSSSSSVVAPHVVGVASRYY